MSDRISWLAGISDFGRPAGGGRPGAIEEILFVLARAVTYAVLFIGLVIAYLPARLITWYGIVRPVEVEAGHFVGMAIAAAGGVIALWSIFTFASLGRGTPAPLDPPRRLVIWGPYRFV